MMMKKRTEKGMLFKLQQKVALYEAVTKEIADLEARKREETAKETEKGNDVDEEYPSEGVENVNDTEKVSLGKDDTREMAFTI